MFPQTVNHVHFAALCASGTHLAQAEAERGPRYANASTHDQRPPKRIIDLSVLSCYGFIINPEKFQHKPYIRKNLSLQDSPPAAGCIRGIFRSAAVRSPFHFSERLTDARRTSCAPQSVFIIKITGRFARYSSVSSAASQGALYCQPPRENIRIIMFIR